MKTMYHVITGNGKGKTTAALGMALRAAGSGMRVFIAQFVKGKPYAEHQILEQVPGIDFALFGRRCFIHKAPEREDIEVAQKGWLQVQQIVQNKTVDLLILDELHIALYYQLLEEKEVAEFIAQNKKDIEIVTTGRYAPDGLIDLADLVSNIEEVKHYYEQGVEARKGIEF
ncbi:cob(I)yrinic acid a,c-diamide adenosyltransferase [Salinivirga cyanobacteriivorans]